MSVGSRDQAGALARKKARGMPADGAEALHDDVRALELDLGELLCRLGSDGKTEAGCADLIERDAAQLAWQTDRASDLVLDPGHGGLVCAHVGSGNVLLQIPYPGSESPNEPFALRLRQRRIAEDHRFGATVGEAGSRILEGHGAGEPKAFLDADIRRHARTTDRRSRGRIVDDDDRPEADAGLVDVHDLLGAKFVGESEDVLHPTIPFMLPLWLYCGLQHPV